MKTAGIITIVWGVLLIAGGVMGGIQAESNVSMIAGAGSGLIALAAAVFMLRGQRAGLIVALVLALLLALFGFGTWLGAAKSFMPRGVIGILSLLELIALAPAMRGGSTQPDQPSPS